MLSVLVVLRRFGRCTQGAMTIDFVVLTAMAVIITAGFGSPLFDALSTLAESLRAQLEANPIHDFDSWD